MNQQKKPEGFHVAVCKFGQDTCCKFLVHNGGQLACNKIVSQPPTFMPFDNAVGDNCEGQKSLAEKRMEYTTELCREIYDNLPVIKV